MKTALSYVGVVLFAVSLLIPYRGVGQTFATQMHLAGLGYIVLLLGVAMALKLGDRGFNKLHFVGLALYYPGYIVSKVTVYTFCDNKHLCFAFGSLLALAGALIFIKGVSQSEKEKTTPLLSQLQAPMRNRGSSFCTA